MAAIPARTTWASWAPVAPLAVMAPTISPSTRRRRPQVERHGGEARWHGRIPGGDAQGSRRGLLVLIRRGHTLLPVDAEAALVWGALTRGLRRRGQPIGSNDLWIAATSLRHGLPLVTADAGHFGRIEGLEVLGYQ